MDERRCMRMLDGLLLLQTQFITYYALSLECGNRKKKCSKNIVGKKWHYRRLDSFVFSQIGAVSCDMCFLFLKLALGCPLVWETFHDFPARFRVNRMRYS